MIRRNLGASSSFRWLFLRLRLSSELAPFVWMGVRRDIIGSVLVYLLVIPARNRAVQRRSVFMLHRQVIRLFLHDPIQDTGQADRGRVQRAAQKESSGPRVLIE